MDKNKTHPTLKTLLYYDVKLTKFFVSFLLNFKVFRSMKRECWLWDISCNWIAWFAGWLAFRYMFNSPSLDNMQIIMLVGLFIDIVIVAVLKATTKRRRPKVFYRTFGYGPDKFSFPSGHVSRAFFILGFFTFLYPLPSKIKTCLLIWASGVAVTRLLMYRYLLDIVGGIFLGMFEILVLNVIWVGPELIKRLPEAYVPGGAE